MDIVVEASELEKEICLVPGTNFCIGSIDSRNETLLEKYDICLIVVLLSDNQRSEIQHTDGSIMKCYRSGTDDGMKTSIKQLLYHLVDMPGSNILPIIDDVRKEISKHFKKSKNGNILFHCMAGISRSPSVVIGLLMHEGFSYEDAYEMIMKVRNIEPDPCFAYQLATLDTTLRKMEVL
jgi:predicted protein tyrosine phosphatase